MIKERLIDLDRDQLDLLHTILKRHIPDKAVWAYGSRATWKAEETSDLDLAVFGCDSMEIHALKEALEESDLLLSVDVMDWESIPENFRENIGEKYVVLQEEASRPEGWREVRLGEVAEVNPKETIPKGTEAPKVLMDFLVPHTKRIPQYIVENYKGGSKFRNGDTLVARITPCLENGKTSFVDILERAQVGFGSTEFIVLREKPQVTDKHYLYYLAVSDDFRDVAVKSMTGTSGRQRVVTDEILRYKFFLPELLEQKAIAEVLSSLDDKIDLLHRQNKTLEAIAQALFRKWFVEHKKDERWKVFSLYDAIELVGGGTPSTSVPEYWDGEIGWVSGRDVAANHKGIIPSTEKSISVEGLKNSSAKLIPGHSTVISARGTVGKYCILSEPMAFSQSNYGIMPKFGDSYFFTYLLINYSIDELQAAAYGSVFDTITTDTFKGHSVKLPQVNVIQEFEIEVTPLFDKMISNQSQIQILENLRGTLLPKLMSGSARVNHTSTVSI